MVVVKLDGDAMDDLSELPTDNDVVETLVLSHLRKLLAAARQLEKKEAGNITLRGALLGYPKASRLFMDTDMLAVVEKYLRWPNGFSDSMQRPAQAERLRVAIDEILRSRVEASPLSELGLRVEVKYALGLDARFGAWIVSA